MAIHSGSHQECEPTSSGPEAGTGRELMHRALVPTILLGVALITVFALVGDTRELADAFRRFNWWLIVPILALTVWNYGWRFLKWQIYLGVLGIRLSTGLSARIFLGGFAMSLTPGKVGELVKAIHVRRATGAPVNRTSAVVAAERITDALAMLILAVVGATQYGHGRTLLAIVASLGAFGILVLQRPTLLNRYLTMCAGLPLLGRLVHHGTAFIDASGTLFRPAILLKAVGLGIISWSGECIAFLLVLIGLGIEPSAELLLIATFILAISSLAGGASMLPGGLGVADAGIAGLLVLLVKDEEMTRSAAAAATILIRFATLWFAVILGALALALLERSWGRVETVTQPLQSSAQSRNEDETPRSLETVGDGGNL
jgi:glycosyltransferase 2 family protein